VRRFVIIKTSSYSSIVEKGAEARLAEGAKGAYSLYVTARDRRQKRSIRALIHDRPKEER